MDYFGGIDVSLEQSSVCVVDAKGRIVQEAKVPSEPEALIAWFRDLDLPLSRIGLEAGPLSQWLYAALAEAGFGWFRPVHCKSLPAQEVRALLTARKLVQTKLHDVEMSLRGILRGFGLKVGQTTSRTFEGRIRELVAGHPTLAEIARALLAARAVLHQEFQSFERRVRTLARNDDRAKLLMSAPGVGVLVSLTFTSAIDEPERFKRSKQVGAHFGMTPKRYQSGEKDITGRISKIGDRSVRTVLYEAANIILTKPLKAGPLKSWAMRLAARAGKKKAKVALARKLAVILHRMLISGMPFNADRAAMARG